MSDVRRLPPILILLLAVAVSGNCGKKGPPLAPLLIVPARIEDLSARRLGSRVILRFTVPNRNQTGESPADIERVELYGFTGSPMGAAGVPLSDEDFSRYATLIARIEIRPPPPPPEEPAPPPVSGDDRPEQGASLTVTETLSDASLIPVDIEEQRRRTEEEPPGPIIPAFWPPPEPEAKRYYLAVGFNHRNQPGPGSARLAVPLVPPPAPPETAPSLQYNANQLFVSWRPASHAPRPVQQPAVEPILAATSIGPVVPSFAYQVYESPTPEAGADAVIPLNPAPLEVLEFVDPRVEVGVTRCYAVRTLQRLGSLSLESEPSPGACVTLQDSFRPAPPSTLAAIGSAGAISLIWEPSPSADVVGYVILRGEAPGETLQQLTPKPVRETTYRDTAVRSGVRYVYVVRAVDGATPANVSLPSNRAEEMAR